ncbi:MAG: isoprenyl transferase [Elusimicrobiales bacterium]|nr:isoprenyl transferase [Elusimicrobiales bacterium]HOJ86858.1 isoprenyl transferase [Elusimicrobiales bacterium]HPO94810.1 isoprenyl transferase [Elusimicrobiales bacterium]
MIDQIRKIPKEKFPQHIAIIMDGNRRWAVEKGYPKFYGHKKGIDTVKTVVKAAKKIGVKYLTLYAFSTENWKRSNKEVSTLMALLKQAIKTYTPELLENDVSLKISGRVQEFSAELKKEIDKSVLKLSNCSSMVLNLALNYGGRAEIVDAVNKCLKNGLTEITEKDINDNLYTHPLPDPDLIIRTSGEMRISNFLIWQSAYSEFFVTSKYWPDFDEKDLFEAVINYSKRERRMGR